MARISSTNKSSVIQWVIGLVFSGVAAYGMAMYAQGSLNNRVQNVEIRVIENAQASENHYKELSDKVLPRTEFTLFIDLYKKDQQQMTEIMKGIQADLRARR